MTPDEAKELGLEPSDPNKEPQGEQFTILPYEEPPPRDPSKTGNKPKQLVAVEVWGYEVGRGNRKKVVAPQDVYELAAIGCSDSEIARWFDIAESTLKYNFSDILAKGREDVKMTLRRAMLKNALNGNAVMQIWLSKNMLGMSDNPNSSQENQPLPWVEDKADDADSSPE
jgi:DNA-binding CsgD family transcriptional regulator